MNSIAFLQEPKWELTEELIPIPNTLSDREMADRIEAILRDSDANFLKKLNDYLFRFAKVKCPQDADIRVHQYLEMHPVRKAYYAWLTHYYEMTATTFILMNQNKRITFDVKGNVFIEKNTPLRELDVNDPIDAIALAFVEQPEPVKNVALEKFGRTALEDHACKDFKCGCGISWDAILYGATCAKCGEQRPHKRMVF